VPTKRRVRGEGSFSQRKSDGLWVGTVDLGWAGGKRVRKSVSAKTRKAASAKFVKLKRDLEKSGGVTSSSTVEAWLNHWLDTIATERNRARTIQGYRGYINTWLIPYLGAHRLDRLSEDHVRAMLRAMRDQGKSDATRRQARAILHRALMIAEREGRVSRNVAHNVEPPKTDTNERTPLTLLEVRAIMTTVAGTPLESRWLAALWLGLRQGEALGLRWEDVDLDAGLMSIRQTVQRQTGLGLVVTPPKSKASRRTFPVPTFVLASLKRRRNLGLPGELVWGKADGPMDPRQDWQAWKDMLTTASVGDHPLHAARNTTATLLMGAKVDPKLIAQILGHSTVKITQDIYQHGDAVMLAGAMKALEAYVKPKAKRARKS